MKKILIILFAFFTWAVSFSQVDINQLFINSPELIIKFQIQERSELEILTHIVSIDKVKGNEVTAYTNKKGFEQFLTLNISYEIVEKPVLTPEYLNILNDEEFKNSRSDWNYYPTYSQYLTLMNGFANDFPDICRLVKFGESVQNRDLLACVISKNVNEREAEPQVFFTSSMHGDERTGYVLMLQYIEYLLENYGSNERITYLLDNMEIWINPLANPDGTFHTPSAWRYNANGIDLNRNYYDWKLQGYEESPEQQETTAFCNLQAEENFTLAVNIHGGGEVCNYAWDNTQKPNVTADHDWWDNICKAYADTAKLYSPGTSYMRYTYCDANPIPDCYPGVVYGADWYMVFSGRQDYANYYNHTREFCLEISNNKTPPANNLPNYWNYNYRSFLNYTQESLYGIHGTVTDATTGEPLLAQIFVNNHDINNSYVMTDPRVGYYVRPIKGGTYSVTYSAEGYISQTKSITVSDKQQVIQNITLFTPTDTIMPIANFEADTTEIFENETIRFTNLSENATDWSWYFEGGTPETSTEQNPTILYENKGSFSVTLTASNEFGNDEMTKLNYITVNEKINICEIDVAKFNIFPNPVKTNSTITIESEIDIIKVEFVNLLGEVVKTIEPQTKPYNISISGIENGMYVIKMETEKSNYISKIVIY